MPTDESRLNTLLDSFGRFGVDLGLDRILHLLDRLGNPQRRVPIIHVAGSNGKGSVCAYLASVLAAAGYRVGRYTSPHLVSWRERICINGAPIAGEDLERQLQRVVAAIDTDQPSPTQFEVFTAAAWLHFAEVPVDVAVIEVGLGGRLDATNVVDTPLVSVITSLSREHWQRLGPTLADIAREKAGILKPGCAAVIGPLPPEAEGVVKARLAAVGSPAVWPEAAVAVGTHQARCSWDGGTVTYDLPLPGAHQLVNSALAIAALQQLHQQGWQISPAAIQQGMAQTQWPGRLQWVNWISPTGTSYPLLVDGAHNPAAAIVLRQYVDSWQRQRALDDDCPEGDYPEANEFTADHYNHHKGNRPPTDPRGAEAAASGVTWLMGMLSTKDHREVFEALLRPGDRLHLVPVPEHLSSDPQDLAAIAQAVCPTLAQCQTHTTLAAGLAAIAEDPAPLTVFCGSLYLIGHFLATEAIGNRA